MVVRFTTDSVVEYIIDNNENTGWKTSQENVLLTIQLEAEYQVNILSHIVLFYDLIFLLLFTVHLPTQRCKFTFNSYNSGFTTTYAISAYHH